jgi:hypothetical protein
MSGRKFSAEEIRLNCYSLVLSHVPWVGLGYSRRPPSGKFWRLWRRSWRVALDDVVRRELIAMYGAAFFVAGVAEDKTPERLIATLTENTELLRPLHFSSQEEGKAYLSQAIGAYIAARPGGWGIRLYKHSINIPNKAWRTRFIWGALRSVGAMHWPITRLRHVSANWNADESPLFAAAVLLGQLPEGVQA